MSICGSGLEASAALCRDIWEAISKPPRHSSEIPKAGYLLLSIFQSLPMLVVVLCPGLLVVSGKTWEAWGYSILEETEVPSFRYVLSFLDMNTEALPNPYNRSAPSHVSMATHVLPLWHHQLHVHIYVCGGGSLQLISIPILPPSIEPTRVQGQRQVLLTAVSCVHRTEPGKEMERCTKAQEFGWWWGLL